MIRSLFYSPDGRLKTGISKDDLPKLLQIQDGMLWVDFQNAPNDEAEPILRETFGFHPLAIDDALQESHVPKLDDWGAFLYVVLHAVDFDEQEQDVHTCELDIFLGLNYIVTHHDQPLDALEKIWSSLQRDERHLKGGPDHVLYLVVDEIATGYMPVVEQLDLSIDRLEEEIFAERKQDTLERIFRIKRAVLYLRRVLSHHREVLNKLARDENKVIDAADRIYFRDVYDHMVRLYDITEGVRDLVSGALDTYLSAINNRMNEIMKTLTIITTLFMPLTFITGFFGMNFFQPVTPLDVWTGRPAFLITILITGLTPYLMYRWMNRRRWM
jgi:magnesium transporter